MAGSTKPPRVSLIIPAHAEEEHFNRCLASVAEASPPPDEVIVVFDGPAGESAILAAKHAFKTIHLESRGGPARARNRGAQHAKGEVLFFVDSDVTIPRHAIGFVQSEFKHQPKLAALFGSYDDSPAMPNFLSQYKNLLHHYTHQQGQRDASTFWGACGAIRKDIFEGLGGFDESYLWLEDIELGHRLKIAGWKIVLAKELQVKHWKRWTPNSLLLSDFFHRALPWTKLIVRDKFMTADLNLSPANRLSVFLVFALVSGLLAMLAFPLAGYAAAISALGILLLNKNLYAFFLRKRGGLFLFKALVWHWLYLLYSGLAFAIGIILYSPYINTRSHKK